MSPRRSRRAEATSSAANALDEEDEEEGKEEDEERRMVDAGLVFINMVGSRSGGQGGVRSSEQPHAR